MWEQFPQADERVVMLRREVATRTSGRARASREIGKRAMSAAGALRQGLRPCKMEIVEDRDRLILRQTRIAPPKRHMARRLSRSIAADSVPSPRRPIVRQLAVNRGHHRPAAALAAVIIGTAPLPVPWGSAVTGQPVAMVADRVRNSICGSRSCEARLTARAANRAPTAVIAERPAMVDREARLVMAGRTAHRATAVEVMPRAAVAVIPQVEVVVTRAAVAEAATAAVVDTGKPSNVC